MGDVAMSSVSICVICGCDVCAMRSSSSIQYLHVEEPAQFIGLQKHLAITELDREWFQMRTLTRPGYAEPIFGTIARSV